MPASVAARLAGVRADSSFFITSMMSTSQLCYHSQATHSTLQQTICESPGVYLLLLLLRNASDLRNCTSYFGACMWVRYCRTPIGAHFHPNPQPPPVPQQLGEKAHLRVHGLWMILCYYSLDGSPLRGMASLLHCGRTPLVGVKITNFSKNAQNDLPWSKTPFRNPFG